LCLGIAKTAFVFSAAAGAAELTLQLPAAVEGERKMLGVWGLVDGAVHLREKRERDLKNKRRETKTQRAKNREDSNIAGPLYNQNLNPKPLVKSHLQQQLRQIQKNVHILSQFLIGGRLLSHVQ
jgi:hypothetical protein